MKKGFTLIELLVVVLIIGILAAIAVPQYQKAVTRARAAEGFTAGKAFWVAEQAYFLQKYAYTANPDDLDVGMSNATVSGASVIMQNFDINLRPTDPRVIVVVRSSSGVKPQAVGYEIIFGPYGVFCRTKTGDSAGNSLCKSMGGANPQIYVGGWYDYQLPY